MQQQLSCLAGVRDFGLGSGQNSGVLPLRGEIRHVAVIGPTADLLPSILGNYVGTPVRPVTPLDGMSSQFHASSILYAQGSTLADGLGVPVPRTVFSASHGLKTEFFSTPDWTGRPVAVLTQPEVQTDWENAHPVPQIETNNYSVRWSGQLTVPAAGHYVFTLESGDSFPYSPQEGYRFILDGKVTSEGSLRQGGEGGRWSRVRPARWPVRRAGRRAGGVPSAGSGVRRPSGPSRPGAGGRL